MDPVFITVYGRPIYWYGVMTALGFLAAVAHWAWLGRRQGRPSELASELGIWVMVGGILGARLLYVATNMEFYAAHPLDILRIDKGGQVWYGGFVGGTLGILLLARLRKEPLAAFADFVVTGVPLGHAIGRIGCFLNGCCYGKACDLPWAVTVDGIPSHPAPLYAVAANLLIYGILVRWILHPRHRPGSVVALYLTLYPLWRLLLQQVRADYPAVWLGLDAAQWTSIWILAAAAVLWVRLYRRPGGKAHG
jgi:phosphatidylglycerol:prolipoprotein diacylglycerol transferase